MKGRCEAKNPKKFVSPLYPHSCKATPTSCTRKGNSIPVWTPPSKEPPRMVEIRLSSSHAQRRQMRSRCGSSRSTNNRSGCQSRSHLRSRGVTVSILKGNREPSTFKGEKGNLRSRKRSFSCSCWRFKSSEACVCQRCKSRRQRGWGGRS